MVYLQSKQSDCCTSPFNTEERDEEVVTLFNDKKTYELGILTYNVTWESGSWNLVKY